MTLRPNRLYEEYDKVLYFIKTVRNMQCKVLVAIMVFGTLGGLGTKDF